MSLTSSVPSVLRARVDRSWSSREARSARSARLVPPRGALDRVGRSDERPVAVLVPDDATAPATARHGAELAVAEHRPLILLVVVQRLPVPTRPGAARSVLQRRDAEVAAVLGRVVPTLTGIGWGDAHGSDAWSHATVRLVPVGGRRRRVVATELVCAATWVTAAVLVVPPGTVVPAAPGLRVVQPPERTSPVLRGVSR